MKRYVANRKFWIAIAAAILAGVLVPALAGREEAGFTVTSYGDVVRFEAGAAAVSFQIRIFALSGRKLWDSGEVPGRIVDWARTDDLGERLAYGVYLYVAQGWNASGEIALEKKGKLAFLPGDEVRLQAAPSVPMLPETARQPVTSREEPVYGSMAYSHSGNFTVSGYLGVGTEVPTSPVTVKLGVPAVAPLINFLNFAGRAVGTFGTISGDNADGWVAWGKANAGVDGEVGFALIGDVPDVTPDAPWEAAVYVRGRNVSTGGNLSQYPVFKVLSGDASTAYLTVAANGRVGVGTLTPSARLHITGNEANLLALYDTANPADAKFRVEKDGDVYADGSYYSPGAAVLVGSADIAERINTSEWVEAGNVVEIDPEHPGFFRKATAPYSVRVAGVISTSPGVILGNDFDAGADKWEDNRPVLALAGRVPVKVTTENGAIGIGDLLVSSSRAGYAMRAESSEKAVGTVIGKALEALTAGEGVILAQVILR